MTLIAFAINRNYLKTTTFVVIISISMRIKRALCSLVIQKQVCTFSYPFPYFLMLISLFLFMLWSIHLMLWCIQIRIYLSGILANCECLEALQSWDRCQCTCRAGCRCIYPSPASSPLPLQWHPLVYQSLQLISISSCFNDKVNTALIVSLLVVSQHCIMTLIIECIFDYFFHMTSWVNCKQI